MRRHFIISIFLLIFCLFQHKVHAVPSSREIFTLNQPDGSIIKARYIGDEWFNLVETQEGYTIVFDSTNKTWFYAELSLDGDLKSTGIQAHKTAPIFLLKKICPEYKKIKEKIEIKKNYLKGKSFINGLSSEPIPPMFPVPKLGEQKLLVILVNFLDQSPIGSKEEDWEMNFFAAENSVNSFYKEVSYGKFYFIPAEENSGKSNNGIINWITLPYNHPNTGRYLNEINFQIIKDAIIKADEYVDFSLFDINKDKWVGKDELFVIVVVAGYEGDKPNPAVWAHQSWLEGKYVPTVDGVRMCEKMGPNDRKENGYVEMGEWYSGKISPIGIAAHEIGHLLDLPDLYDIDLSSKGIGDWCLMSYGSWNMTANPGDSPSHLSAWCKTRLGWINPETIESITYSKELLPVENNASAAKIWEDAFQNNRYFLLEYRNNSGFDKGLPGEGLLIWHINEDVLSNENDSSRLVDLEEADGFADIDSISNSNYGDDGDPYPGSKRNYVFDNNSTPGSKDYFGDSTCVSIKNISLNPSNIIMDVLPRRIKGYTLGYDEFGFNWYIYNTDVKTVGVVFYPGETGKLVKLKLYFLKNYMTYNIGIYASKEGSNLGKLLYTQKGENDLSGWRIITLDSSIPIEKGNEPFIEITQDLQNQGYYYNRYSLDYYGSKSGKSFGLMNNGYRTWDFDLNVRAMFTVKPLPPQTGFIPYTGNKVNLLTPEILWDRSKEKITSDIGNLKHTLRLDDDGEIENDFKYEYDAGNSTHFTLLEPLTDKTKWYYAVRTVDEFGTQGDWSQLQSFEVDTDEKPPLSFDLLSPGEGEEVSLVPDLSWSEAVEEDLNQSVAYNLYLDNNEDFSSPEIVKMNLKSTNYTIQKEDGLNGNTIYFWKVRAYDNYNIGIWSDIFTFYTNKEDDFTVNLISPTEIQEVSVTPALTWNKVQYPDSKLDITYDLYIDNNEDFSSQEIIKSKLIDTTYIIDEKEKLQDHTKFYWKVRACDNYNIGIWSTINNFITNNVNEPPEASVLFQPYSQEIFNSQDKVINFQWTASRDPDPFDTFTYILRIAKNKNISEDVIEIKNLITCEYTLDTPEGGSRYYWGVRVCDNHGASTDSKIQSFSVEGTSIPPDKKDKKSKPWWKKCFITFILQNDNQDKKLQRIIQLRDKYLLNNFFGYKFSQMYYKFSSYIINGI